MAYRLHTFLVFIIIQGYVHGAQLPVKEDEASVSSDQDFVASKSDTPESLQTYPGQGELEFMQPPDETQEEQSFNVMHFENDEWEECKFGMQLRCKGNGLAMTCDRLFENGTKTYECLSGEGYNVYDDMTCCKPCCYRSDPSDVHKRCADIDYEDLTCPRDIDDCLTLRMRGETRSGVYKVFQGSSMEEVYCDMETDGGGWTVIQSHVDGSVDFDRPWAEYEAGFGDPRSNYWMGLKRMHALTSPPVELYIYLQRFSGRHAYAKYSSFSVSDANTQYMVQLSGYSGTAGNDFQGNHNYMQFTTKDRDNDRCSCNCAVKYPSGWWYNNCHRVSLNGYYFPMETKTYAGIHYKSFVSERSLYQAKMMIRPHK